MKDEIEYNVISWIQPDAPNKKFYKEYHVAQTFQEALEKFDELKYKNSLFVRFIKRLLSMNGLKFCRIK